MAKRATVLGAALGAAMILSYIESLIPAFVAVPGMKLGLSNIATVFVLYRLSWREAFAVSFVRILLSALLFGSFLSLLYSACGALLSLTAMIILKKSDTFSIIGTSIAGGVFHNIGQIAAAIFVMGTKSLIYYLPPLIISGTVAGTAIGILAGLLVRRFSKINFNKI